MNTESELKDVEDFVIDNIMYFLDVYAKRTIESYGGNASDWKANQQRLTFKRSVTDNGFVLYNIGYQFINNDPIALGLPDLLGKQTPEQQFPDHAEMIHEKRALLEQRSTSACRSPD